MHTINMIFGAQIYKCYLKIGKLMHIFYFIILKFDYSKSLWNKFQLFNRKKKVLIYLYILLLKILEAKIN